MAEPMSSIPAEVPVNYLPYIVMVAIGAMVSIVAIVIFGTGDNSAYITVIGTLATGIVVSLIGRQSADTQRALLSTHKAVNSAMSRWAENTEAAAQAAKTAADAAVATALGVGRTEGMAEQLATTQAMLDRANMELTKIAELRRLLEEKALIAPSPAVALPPSPPAALAPPLAPGPDHVKVVDEKLIDVIEESFDKLAEKEKS